MFNSGKRFRKLLEYLKPRYAQGGSSTAIPGLDLPDTIEEFYQQYELTYSPTNLRHRRPILEVKNVVDVNCSVVYNVIHSSMCTTEDKSAWGFHLFNIYQQYPDNLVRSTLAKMKNDMMIAQRKRSLVRYLKEAFYHVEVYLLTFIHTTCSFYYQEQEIVRNASELSALQAVYHVYTLVPFTVSVSCLSSFL